MWDKIKKILQKEGEKCIIILEKGEPAYLVKKLEENKEEERPLSDSSNSDNKIQEIQEIEKANRDIAELEAKGETEGEENLSEDIKVEDLPF